MFKKNLFEYQETNEQYFFKPSSKFPNIQIKLFFNFRGIKEYNYRFQEFINVLKTLNNSLLLDTIKISDKLNKSSKGKIKKTELDVTYINKIDKPFGTVVSSWNFISILKNFLYYNSGVIFSCKIEKNYLIINLLNLKTLNIKNFKNKKIKQLLYEDSLSIKIMPYKNNDLKHVYFLKNMLIDIDNNFIN